MLRLKASLGVDPASAKQNTERERVACRPLTPPSKLLGSDSSEAVSCRLRLSTGTRPDDGATEWGAGANVAVVGASGCSSLHFVEGLSADGRFRFDRGSVDEVELLVPAACLPVRALWIAPRAGKWTLERADLLPIPAAGYPEQRFNCGFNLDDGAELLPLQTAVLSDEERDLIREEGLAEYGALKTRLLGTNALIGTAGASIAFVLGGPSMSLSFAAGAAVGTLYLTLISRGVDALPSADDDSSPSRLSLIAGSSTFRLLVVSTASFALARLASLTVEPAELRVDLLIALLGFLTYKPTVLICALVDEGEEMK
mmetsp:Transcript_102/g.296  ORF Transcript_102/g.296 Transcript_102/m.296 type:complete len:314 (-) Transcript_102:38-979(-)